MHSRKASASRTDCEILKSLPVIVARVVFSGGGDVSWSLDFGIPTQADSDVPRWTHLTPSLQ